MSEAFTRDKGLRQSNTHHGVRLLLLAAIKPYSIHLPISPIPQPPLTKPHHLKTPKEFMQAVRFVLTHHAILGLESSALTSSAKLAALISWLGNDSYSLLAGRSG